MTEPKLNGLIATYRDDQIDESVRLALKGKSRVRYKCMDTFAHFLAFGTSSGAIYLYRLNVVTHSTCSLMSMIPCDQGSIEVIKFLPSPQADDLLIAIGTSRGSIVILRLFQAPQEQNAYCDEIYKAEYFTNNSSIKLIESDQDLLDPGSSFSRLYICDSADRLYILESNIILSNKNGLRLFRQSHLPALIFSVNDSRINQISVHRSNLLISTDETTRLFNEQSNQLNVIGKKKRKLGFYGACFFNPNHKLNRSPHEQQKLQSQSTSYSSLVSLNDLDSLLIFVARPMFRMWQVNNRCEVMFTHQFEQSLKACKFTRIVEVDNVPLEENVIDEPADVMKCFDFEEGNANSAALKSDHFQRLIPIYSSTLGNLLMSYSQHEVFFMDPIGAELITWCSFKELIVQICCNDNEVFIWCQTIENEQKRFQLKRLVLLAPTQFVLELHRIHRFLSLVMFVQRFADLFRDRMALPLSGAHIITTEGGLLRNILLNAWDVVNHWRNNGAQLGWLSDLDTYCAEFKRLAEEIIDESEQLKSSFDNLTDSRFFLAMTNENIDRLLSEPYASLVSLEVSIAELHVNHVIHFSKEAINRHKSVSNLSQNLRDAVYEAKNKTKSTMDLSNHNDCNANTVPSRSMRDLTNTSLRAKRAQVIVDRQHPRRNSARFSGTRFDKVEEDSVEEQLKDLEPEASTFFSVKAAQENLSPISEANTGSDANINDDGNPDDAEPIESSNGRQLDVFRCKNCRWPKAGGHLEPMNSKQLDQLRWIEENLTTNFFENIDLIEERAFENSLWRIFLRCLAFKRQTDNYIICCMLLDDVRLLDIEQLVIICSGEDEMMNLLLGHLNREMMIHERASGEPSLDNEERPSKRRAYCLKCSAEYEPVPDDTTNGDEENSNTKQTSESDPEDEFNFNLANLFNVFIKRSNSNIRKMVGHFLNYNKLLNNSKIPIRLYLEAIERAVNRPRIFKQSALMSQESSFWNSDKAL